jgi:hypothetical protein
VRTVSIAGFSANTRAAARYVFSRTTISTALRTPS